MMNRRTSLKAITTFLATLSSVPKALFARSQTQPVNDGRAVLFWRKSQKQSRPSFSPVPPFLHNSGISGKKVAIYGGGVSGLSVAHELIERGFEVTVYEKRDVLGGKARSMDVEVGSLGVKKGHGEHGFRFFPGFYQYIPDIMQRIPYKNQSVYENLVPVEDMIFAHEGRSNTVLPAGYPENFEDMTQFILAFWGEGLGVSRKESAFFAERLFQMLTSSDERMFYEYEDRSWWEYTQADRFSESYKKMNAGLTRALVAMRPQSGSARTVGSVLLQLLLTPTQGGAPLDRVLNGPTSEVWLHPWYKYLKSKGVVFKISSKVEGFSVQQASQGFEALETLKGVHVYDEALKRSSLIEADFHVLALPLEVLSPLLPEPLLEKAPSLKGIQKLKTDWMVGAQFYLRQDLPLGDAHVVFSDSPWALTAVTQHQYWPDFFGEQSHIQGILSIDISEWEKEGILYSKKAKECSKEEIKNEVLAQMKNHLSADKQRFLDEENIIDWHLDPAVRFENSKVSSNEEPLFINTLGSWWDRPFAACELPNLYVVGDYVRTETDLATMESAQEAARRAVNVILETCTSPDVNTSPCELFPLFKPVLLEPQRVWDTIMMRLGLSHVLERRRAR